MLTAILSLLTVLSWFLVVRSAGGFAGIAMIFFVPGYLLTYGLVYLFPKYPLQASCLQRFFCARSWARPKRA